MNQQQSRDLWHVVQHVRYKGRNVMLRLNRKKIVVPEMNKHRLYEFLGARKTCYLGSVQCYINFCENCIVSTTARYKNYLSTIICRKIVILLCKTLEVHAWVHLICLLLASIKVSIVLL